MFGSLGGQYFPFSFPYAINLRENTAHFFFWGGRQRNKAPTLLNSSFSTLVYPWLVMNVFPLSFLTLGRVSRCGCSIILAIVQLMPVVLALLCFVVRGFSSDLCHIKIRSVITGLRFDGSVQQEAGLSFLPPLALMSRGVDSLQPRSTRRAARCSSCCCPRDARRGSDAFAHLGWSVRAQPRPPLLVWRPNLCWGWAYWARRSDRDAFEIS